jgi:hypothetical protein
MTFTFSFKKQFAIEFLRYPIEQQDKILGFAETFEQHGLGDFSCYQGKITPSWKGVYPPHPDYEYALTNDLWHYHIGIPHYTSVHAKYMTSDCVLHFQWVNQGNHIDLVDIYDHYRADGSFYLPPLANLAD